MLFEQEIRLGGDAHVTVLDMTHANDVIRIGADVVPTLQSRMGTGGNQIPLIMEKEKHGLTAEMV